MKKVLSILLAITFVFTIVPTDAFSINVSAQTSGITGECTWNLDGTVLTISGNGVMDDYDYWNGMEAPWGNEITKVIIEDGVSSISNSAFENSLSLTSVTIPDSVLSIGKNAFAWCEDIVRVYIEDVYKWCNINFANNYSNPLINGANLYLNGVLVTNVTVPDGLEKINNVFTGCTSISNIIIPNSVTEIGDNEFKGCSRLEKINIPDSVTKIGKSAFYGCSSLSSINIPNSVTSIGVNAFYNCDILEEIYFPASVSIINESVFYNTSIKTIYYSGDELLWKDMVVRSGNSTFLTANIEYNYGKNLVEPIGVSISSLPNKTEYFYGTDFLDLTGCVIEVEFSDGKKLKTNVTYDMVSEYNNFIIGKQSLTVTYGQVTTEFTVNTVLGSNLIENVVVTVGEDEKIIEVFVNNNILNYYIPMVNINGDVVNEYQIYGNDGLVFSLSLGTTSYANITLALAATDGTIKTFDVVKYDFEVFEDKIGKYMLGPKINMGDSNEDGVTNIKDVIRIKKTIVEIEDFSDSADISGDGSVTTSDLISLAKFIIMAKKGVRVHTVTFTDSVGNVFETAYVPDGFAAKPSVTPEKYGFVFKGWETSLSNIVEDRTVYAMFELGAATGEVDVNGYSFVIQSNWMAKTVDAAVMEQEKSFYKVAAQIEEKYGCTINIESGNMTMDNMRTLIMSGSKIADAVDIEAEQVLPFAAAGYIVPWKNIGIDATNSNYVQSYTNLAIINGDCYGMNFLRAPEASMSVIFNKGVLKSAGINADGIYDLVKAKKWNWETLRSYAKTVVQKNTSNNVTYVWGVGGWFDKFIRGLYVSNGATLATTKNGKGVTTFASANMKEALNFASTLINEDKVYDATDYRNADSFDMSDNGYYEEQFSLGKLAFLFNETNWIVKSFDKSFDYDIAPIPMGPKASDYATESGKARVLTLTSTNAKSSTADKSAFILDKLAKGCASGGDINNTYDGESWWQYDLKQEYFRNDKDNNLEMYNILLDTATVDYGAATTLKEAFDKTVSRDAILCNKGTIESAIQSIGSQYDTVVSEAFTFK